MTDMITDDLVRRIQSLLRPGEIDLVGLLIQTEYDGDEEHQLIETVLEIGEIVAAQDGTDQWYVYSGTDDPEFASNQHQGLKLADDSFIWECQTLLRAGTFDIVMYFERGTGLEDVLATLTAEGYDGIGVTEDGTIPVPPAAERPT